MKLHPLFAGFEGCSVHGVATALGFAVQAEWVSGALPAVLPAQYTARLQDGGDLAGYLFAGGWAASGAFCLLFAKPLTAMAAALWLAGKGDSAPAAPGQLKPCPFCSGPPVASIYRWPHDLIKEQESYGGGASVEAFVYCHECGASGPEFEGVIYDRADYRAAIEHAGALWNARDSRHVSLYQAAQGPAQVN